MAINPIPATSEVAALTVLLPKDLVPLVVVAAALALDPARISTVMFHSGLPPVASTPGKVVEGIKFEVEIVTTY